MSIRGDYPATVERSYEAPLDRRTVGDKKGEFGVNKHVGTDPFEKYLNFINSNEQHKQMNIQIWN